MIQVTLNPQAERLVREMVRAGRFRTTDEAASVCLGLLEAQERAVDAWCARNAEPLRRMIHEADAAVDRGEGVPWDAEPFKREARSTMPRDSGEQRPAES